MAKLKKYGLKVLDSGLSVSKQGNFKRTKASLLNDHTVREQINTFAKIKVLPKKATG